LELYYNYIDVSDELFMVKTGWQPCCWSLGLKFRDWLLHPLRLTNLF